MKTAAVAKLKAELSKYLRLVRAGEEILVTDRDVPVARLVPVADLGSDMAGMRDLERRGVLRLGSGRLPKNFWKLPRGRDAKGTLREAAREERERGW